MKNLNFKIAILFLMMIGLSNQMLAQEPGEQICIKRKGCYNIVKVHNDDITWYEVERGANYGGIIYNNKLISINLGNHITYTHGCFFIGSDHGSDYVVMDKYGKFVKKECQNSYEGCFFDPVWYDVFAGKLYAKEKNLYYVFNDNYSSAKFRLIDACVVEFDDKIYLQIKENGRYGFVSKDRQLLDTQYESIERVGNTNYLQIKRNGKYGFYDLKNERYVLAMRYDEISKIGESGLWKLKENGMYGIYDLENERQVLAPRYNEISKMGEIDYYKIKENGKYGLYDLKNEKFVLLPVFNSIGMIKGSNGELFIKAWMDNYHSGFYDISGEEILAPEFEYCDYMGSNLFKFKMNGYMGVMNRDGKIIIPLDRHYTSIDYSRTLKTFTFTKETETAYYKGECNASGVQTSIEKTGTKSKPKQQTQQPKQETKPQQPKQETKPKQETTPTPQPQPQPQPQPRQLQPFQVWHPCQVCGGTGKCHVCLGDGHPLTNPTGRCIVCNGDGKCKYCAGNGGQNVIEYR